MSALSISVPYPVFSGQDGLPLDNGYVWIGTANLYPITNQIAVYFDEALTIQATQPLRTINGFISNAGTPAQVYVDAVNFSILVQDSKGTMVYNFPDGTGLSPNEPFVSVKDFGAVGDGVTDDTAAINAANTYCFNNNKTLFFSTPTVFYRITSNVTITCDMTAGWYQIFDSASAYTVAGLREYRFEWWGAKGNAVSPATPVLGVNLSSFDPVTQLPTGTNDSAAIRATMLNAYSSEMMSNYLDPTVFPAIPGPNIGPGSQPYWPSKQMTGYRSIVKGRPGAGYICSGTNILGPQNNSNNKIFFDGQGCSFEWIPANVYDYFIDRLDLISEPVYQNFEVRNWGHLGYMGVFCHAGLSSGNRKEYGNFLKGPLFHNVRLDAGGNYWYYASNPAGTLHYPDVNAWKICFFIEGTNLNATWEISHGQMYAFETYWSCSNPEAVACNIHDTEIGSWTPSAVFFYFSGQYSGGFWVNNCEIGLVGNTQTLLQTVTTSATQVSSLPFVFRDCRIETRADDFTLFDLQFGDLSADNLFPDAGNPTSMANAIAVRALKFTKKVTITNSWMPQTIVVNAFTSAEWTNLGGAAFGVTLNGCTTPFGTPKVLLFKTDNTPITLAQTYREFLRFATVQYINSNNGLPWTLSVSAKNDLAYHTITLGTFDQTNGDMYVNVNGGFPIAVLITSIVVTALASNLAVTDRIIVQWPNSGPSFTAMLSATDTIKTELIPSNEQGVCVLSTTGGYNNYLINYYLGAAVSSTKVNATVKITYRPIYSLAEMGATDVTALV